MPVEQLTFTDLPRGKGLDPGAAGYQIKACSPGLGPAHRETLRKTCVHYGDAVYSFAPRSSKEKLKAWRSQTTSLQSLPADVVEAFPTICVYDRLGDDLYALTRVRFAGFTHDDRPGNFFAHCLVFAPDALAAYNDNPLSLARAFPFPAADANSGTSLPQLPDLGSHRGPPVDFTPVKAAPFDRLLPNLLAAMLASVNGKPVLLSLPDWRQTIPLSEALFQLLPPEIRCRSTLCTYEKEKDRAAPPCPHQFVVLGDLDTPTLRADEMQAAFAAFHVTGNQFSAPVSSPYADAVAAMLRNGRAACLRDLHQLGEKLGAGRTASAWDGLAPAAALFAATPEQVAVQSALQALTPLATQPSRAVAVLTASTACLRAAAQANNAALIKSMAPTLGTLAGKANSADGGFAGDLRLIASDAAKQGRMKTASALLQAAGPNRERLVRDLFPELIAGNGSPAKRQPEEDKQRTDLVLEGLRLTHKTPGGSWPKDVTAAFRIAAEAGHAAESWAQTGDLVKAHLAGRERDKGMLARSLLPHVPLDQCPDGHGWLQLCHLRSVLAEPQHLARYLEDAARALAAGDAATAPWKDLLEAVKLQTGKADKADLLRAECLGRMLEAVATNKAAATTLRPAYKAAVEELKPDARTALRQTLAAAHVRHVLCRELVESVLPWDDDQGPVKMQEWREQCLNDHPDLLALVRRRVADGLSGDRSEVYQPLAWELLSGGGESPERSGLAALGGALVLLLPLQPLDENVEQALGCTPEQLSPEGASRLRLLRLLRQTQRLSEQPDWSAAQFLSNDPAWAEGLTALDEDDRAKVLGWCLTLIQDVGVTTPSEARGLVELFHSAGLTDTEAMAEAASQLVEERDAVTTVLMTSAFVRGGLENQIPEETANDVVKALIADWDKPRKRLLADYLHKRFGRRGPDDAEALRRLVTAIPELAPEAAPKGQDRSREDGPKSTFVSRWAGFLTGRKSNDGTKS